MKIKFYGVRGSIPTPGSDTEKYGGNTLCTKVRDKDTEIILDAGTGIRVLGNDLIAKLPSNPIETHIFLSHTHWDHIQGLPFFGPVYTKGNEIHIYMVENKGIGLKQALEGQMLPQYFPTSLKKMDANIHLHDIKEGQLVEISGFKIKNGRLNHPFPGATAYRIDSNNKSMVYATDTEHYKYRPDETLLKLANNADVLIYDSQFTPEEYKTRVNWGHSTGQKGVEIAKKAKVKRLVLFHHDPSHTDRDIDNILENCKEIAGKDLEVIVACEGLEIDI